MTLGYLDGELTGAVPDSKPDIIIMSRKYAPNRGLQIQYRDADKLELEFADGSAGYSSGVVKSATRTFDHSRRSVVIDFYILVGWQWR